MSKSETEEKEMTTYKVTHVNTKSQTTTIATGLDGDAARQMVRDLKGQMEKGDGSHYEVHPDK